MSKTEPQKHSITIAGHRTSLTLEDEFWHELKALAKQQSLSVASLIANVDAARGGQNLSSALRVYVLRELKQNQF